MSNQKPPVVGEKPFCSLHPNSYIDWVCAAGSCPYRILCKECIDEHSNYYPHHSTQVSVLNNWKTLYNKVAKSFDPRENYQLNYHVDEIGKILKKEKVELENISRNIDDSFEGVLNILFNKLKSLKEYLQDYLWKDFNKVSENYDQMVKKYSGLKKIFPKEEISKLMEKELQEHFAQGHLKQYFDRVYSGHYDTEVFNSHMDTKEMLTRLQNKRKSLEEGFHMFDSFEFETTWTSEIEKFTKAIETSCDGVIFKSAKLDFLNPKSPKLPAIGKITTASKVTCLSSLDNLSNCYISKVNEGLFMTISEQRQVNFLDPQQNYRSLQQFSVGEELICSIEYLPLTPPEDLNLEHPPASFLVVLGGNDDYPALEVWDCLRMRSLACLENVHEYRISCLKTLKKETTNKGDTFHLVSGSPDGFIKLWQITAELVVHENKTFEHKVNVILVKQVAAHDSFIPTIVVIPACEKFPESIMISCSHDKSLYFWNWESELKYDAEKSQKSLSMSQSLKNDDEEEEALEAFRKKKPAAHPDRINGVILLNDKEDFSDLEYYATGGGEGMIKIWRYDNGTMKNAFSNNNNSPIFSMEYLKRDRIACTANEVYLKHYYVLVWNWRTSSLLLSVRDHSNRVFKVCYIDDNVFATCDKAKTIKLWQLEKKEKEPFIEGHLAYYKKGFFRGNSGLLDM